MLIGPQMWLSLEIELFYSTFPVSISYHGSHSDLKKKTLQGMSLGPAEVQYQDQRQARAIFHSVSPREFIEYR